MIVALSGPPVNKGVEKRLYLSSDWKFKTSFEKLFGRHSAKMMSVRIAGARAMLKFKEDVKRLGPEVSEESKFGEGGGWGRRPIIF